MSLEADAETYFVFRGTKLVYSKPGSIFYHVLACKDKAGYLASAHFTAQPHELRQATLKDFEDFDVNPTAYFGTERARFYQADNEIGVF